MLITLISLSEKTMASESSYLHLKKGAKAPTEVWCFDASNLNELRNNIEKCEEAKIELKHLRKLKNQLVETQTYHKPIWAQWWFKLPAGIALGSLAGILATKSTDSTETAAISGAVVASATVILLDFEF